MRNIWLNSVVGLSIFVAGCGGADTPPPLPEQGIGRNLPAQFSFITTRTTFQQVKDRIGEPTKERGSGITYFEYDLPDGSAVLIGAEWPFEPESTIRTAWYYNDADDIGLCP